MSEQDKSVNEHLSMVDYLKSIGETYRTLRWYGQQFVNQDARSFIKRLLVWSFFSRLVSLAYPFLMGMGLDGLYQHNARFALTAIVGIFLTYIVGAVFEWRGGHNIELTLGENLRVLERKVNELFFFKNLGLHLEEGGKLTQENMEKGLNRFDAVQKSLLFVGTDSGLSFVLSLTMLFFLSPVSGAIVALILVGNLLVSLHLNIFVTKHMEHIEAQFRAISLIRGERWQGAERVITSGRDLEEIEEMDRAWGIALAGDRRIWLHYIRGTMPRSILAGVAVTAVGVYAGWRVWIGQMHTIDIVPILTWAGMASQQMRFLARVEREVNWCTPSLKSLREALLLPNQFEEVTDAYELEDAPVEIRFENLGHGYEHARHAQGDESVEVLSGVSFTITPGAKVAFIGPSGAGKSTVTRLLQRYMDPTHGDIFINGHNLKDVSLRSWRRLVGYIPQSPKVFDGTLRDNLLYGLSLSERTDVSDEKIWEMVRLLRIDFGARLTHGLDTRVGRHGMKLSGGEAQRVMIGAAALKRPRFMIIDEATSSLDAENQAAVQAGIDQLLAQESASAIIIAHRLSTIMACDTFVVLKPVEGLAQGESQIEYVAHCVEDLFAHSPTFRRLAHLEGVRLSA